jgi:phospholipase/lecithinase/hemolysin
MKLTMHSSQSRTQRSRLASLTITLMLWHCAHAFLRGTSSAEDDDASASHDDTSVDATCLAIERANRTKYGSLVVFGDSYSDTGNIWNASNQTQPPSPPYYHGRYSNGRNYVDFVREALALPTNNFAWGGATSNNDIVMGYSTFLNATVPSFQDQVRAHLNQTTDGTTGCPLDDDDDDNQRALYVAVIGYNDYWWYANENVTASTTPEDMEDFVDRVATSIVASVQELVARRPQPGCRAKEDRAVVLVGDVPPMDLLPDALSKTADVRQAYRVLTEQHNARLRLLVSNLTRHDDDDRTTVRLLPVHETMVDLVHRAPCLGFDSASTACLGSSGDDDIGGATTTCDDPYRHLFWDDWHPMTWTHQQLAHAVLSAASLR